MWVTWALRGLRGGDPEDVWQINISVEMNLFYRSPCHIQLHTDKEGSEKDHCTLGNGENDRRNTEGRTHDKNFKLSKGRPPPRTFSHPEGPQESTHFACMIRQSQFPALQEAKLSKAFDAQNSLALMGTSQQQAASLKRRTGDSGLLKLTASSANRLSPLRPPFL